MAHRLLAPALSLVMTTIAGAARAGEPQAVDDEAPVFEGPIAITRYTKEVGMETTSSVTEAGPAVGAGATVSAFYARWLASFAGATYSPGFSAPRERWEARGGGRLVLPSPLCGQFFGFVLGGGGLVFTSAREPEGSYTRALTGILGAGVFTNLGARVRVRLELREHLRLFGDSDTSHTETLGLAIIVLSR